MSEAKDYAAGTLKIQTEGKRITFPNVIEAKAIVKNGKTLGEPKFSVNIEFENDDPFLAEAIERAKNQARAKWPDLTKDAYLALGKPWTSGDKLADKAKANGKDREFSRGRTVLTARSKNPPQLAAFVDGKWRDFNSENINLAKPYFYTGVDALVEVYFEAYDGVGDNGLPGIACYLNGLGSLNKGKRLTGRPSAAETFSGYVGLNKREDVTSGLDTEDAAW